METEALDRGIPDHEDPGRGEEAEVGFRIGRVGASVVLAGLDLLKKPVDHAQVVGTVSARAVNAPNVRFARSSV